MLLNRLNINVKVYFGGSWQGGIGAKKRVIYTGWRTLHICLAFLLSYLFLLSCFFLLPTLGVGRSSSAVTVCISRFTKVGQDSPGMVRYGMIEITLLISVNSRFIVYHIERKILNSVISLVRGAFLSSHW